MTLTEDDMQRPLGFLLSVETGDPGRSGDPLPPDEFASDYGPLPSNEDEIYRSDVPGSTT